MTEHSDHSSSLSPLSLSYLHLSQITIESPASFPSFNSPRRQREREREREKEFEINSQKEKEDTKGEKEREKEKEEKKEKEKEKEEEKEKERRKGTSDIEGCDTNGVPLGGYWTLKSLQTHIESLSFPLLLEKLFDVVLCCFLIRKSFSSSSSFSPSSSLSPQKGPTFPATKEANLPKSDLFLDPNLRKVFLSFRERGEGEEKEKEKEKEKWYEFSYESLLLHLLQVQTNGIAIVRNEEREQERDWEREERKEREEREEGNGNCQQEALSLSSLSSFVEHQRVGVGLFPCLSLLNHSCSPNALFNYFGRDVYLRSSNLVFFLLLILIIIIIIIIIII